MATSAREWSVGPFTFRFGRRERAASTNPAAIKIPVNSPMGSLMAGFKAVNVWGYPQRSSGSTGDALAAYTSYVHACVSARAQRDAASRYILKDRRTGEEIAEERAPVPYTFFRRPNPVMSEYFLKVLISTWMNLAGKAPVLKIRNALGVPVMQWPLLPNRVTAMYDPVDWVRYEFLDDSGRTVKIPGRDIICYRWPHPTKLFDGLGPLEGAGLFHDTDVLLWQWQREMFARGPFATWILEYPEGRGPTTQEQADQLAKNFGEIVGDREHPNDPVVLADGVKAQSFPVTNDGMEVPTINEEIKERIRSAIHVSKTILGEVPGESRANIEGAEYGFARFTEAYHRCIDEENERSLLPEWDERYTGDFENALPADKDFALRQEESDLRGKVLTINEVRKRRGLEDAPWGDTPWGTLGETQIVSDDEDADEPQQGSVAAADDVQKTALNGAQVTALQGIMESVAAGTLAKPAAILLITQAFPDFAEADVAKMVNAVEAKPDEPPVKPAQTSNADEPPRSQSRALDAKARRDLHWRAWAAWQDGKEQEMLTLVRRAFGRQEKAVVKALKDNAPRFLDWTVGKSRAHVADTLDGRFGRSVADDVVAAMDPDDFLRELKPYAVKLYGDAGKVAAKAFSGVFHVDAGGVKKIGSHLSKSTDSVLKTTAKQIKAALKEGFLEGEGVNDLASRIRDIYEGISAGRARVIARTETIEPANLGAVHGYKQAGVLRKEWIATRDDKTRPEHAEADGQVVGIDEDFDVGGEKLAYPGDSRGSAGNVINDRCTVAGVAPGAEEE